MPPHKQRTKIAIERITIGQLLDYWGAGILTKDDRTRERPVVALRASEWQREGRHLDPVISRNRA